MRYLAFVTILIILASCRSGYISKLESEVQSLQLAVDSLSETVIRQQKQVERMETIATEAKEMAMVNAELAGKRLLQTTLRVNKLKDSLNISGKYIRINWANYESKPSHNEFLYSKSELLNANSINIYPDPDNTNMNIVGIESYDLINGKRKKSLPADISKEDLIAEIESFYAIDIGNE